MPPTATITLTNTVSPTITNSPTATVILPSPSASCTQTALNTPDPAVAVYPNPANAQATFLWPERPDGGGEVTLFNTAGERVLRLTMAPGQQMVTGQLNHLAAGLYYVRMTVRDQGQNKPYPLKKLVIRH